MPAYTADPVPWDHQLVIADTYQPAEVQLRVPVSADSEETEPYSLVGATGEMQIRREPLGEVLAEGTVTVTDGALGKFTWLIAAAVTAELQPDPRAHYGVRFTFADGVVKTVLEGRVTIRRGVVS